MIYIHPKNTTIKVEKSILNGVHEERPSLKDYIVKVRSFPDVTVKDTEVALQRCS